jgi:hypothetical protein
MKLLLEVSGEAVTSSKGGDVNSLKLKLSLYLIKHCALEDLQESGGIAPPFLTSALDGGEWLASSSKRFTSWERDPGTHWIGGLQFLVYSS